MALTTMSSASSQYTPAIMAMFTRSIAAALSPTCLFLAAVGFLATNLIGLGGDAIWASSEQSRSGRIQLSTLEPVRTFLADQLGANPSGLPLDPVVGVPVTFIVPFARLFATGQSWVNVFRNLIDGVLGVLVWSFLGLAIVRIAVERCGRTEHCSLRNAVSFSMQKWWDLAGAPLATLLAIVLLAIPVFAISWLVRFDSGVLLLGLSWVFVLAIACLMAVLLVGLTFGWPLMWGVMAAENSDLFDAISRSFAYTYQRPAYYLQYIFLASCFGVFGWAVMCCASELIVQLAFWSVQVGGGATRTEMLRELVENSASMEGVSSSMQTGVKFVRLSNGFLTVMASAFSYSFFWSVFGAIYLLLRFDTDGTLPDDIIVHGDAPQFEENATN